VGLIVTSHAGAATAHVYTLRSILLTGLLEHGVDASQLASSTTHRTLRS
jgi:hypothetical protein